MEDDFKKYDHRTSEDRINDFNGLLDQIESLTDKKKQLWFEIYANAVEDRQNSYAMFVRLARIVQDNSSEHAVHGKSLSAYVERMSKATDQLIRLAELIAKAESSSKQIDPDEMFDRINKSLGT